jgi:hypothetical protein
MLKCVLKHMLKLVMKQILKIMPKLPRIEKIYKCHVETCAETHVKTHTETPTYSEILQVS